MVTGPNMWSQESCDKTKDMDTAYTLGCFTTNTFTKGLYVNSKRSPKALGSLASSSITLQ